MLKVQDLFHLSVSYPIENVRERGGWNGFIEPYIVISRIQILLTSISKIMDFHCLYIGNKNRLTQLTRCDRHTVGWAHCYFIFNRRIYIYSNAINYQSRCHKTMISFWNVINNLAVHLVGECFFKCSKHVHVHQYKYYKTKLSLWRAIATDKRDFIYRVICP